MGKDEDAKTRLAIGKAARKARTTLNMTQAQVADALGLAPEVYGRIERGLMMPSVPTLLRMVSALRITPDQLLGWSSRQPKKRPPEYERILSLLDRADDSSLARTEAVLNALITIEAKNK